MSAGLATYEHDVKSLDDLIARADAALLARFAAVFTWYGPGFSPGEAHMLFVISGVARIFGARGELITIVAPNRNYELNKTGHVRIT